MTKTAHDTGMVRILAIGSLKDQLPKISSKIEKVVKKSGPFSFVVLLSPIGNLSDTVNPFSTPVYFCNSTQEISSDIDESSLNLKNVEEATLLELDGLKVFFAVQQPLQIAVDNALKVVEVNKQYFKGIDVLITKAYPNKNADSDDSKLTAKLCEILRPRYNLCAGNNYQCDDPIIYANAEHNTTVVKIASAAPRNGSEKWAYAADVTPLSELMKKRTNTNGDNRELKKRKTQEKCWFCLAVAEEKHLVVAAGERVYVALAKGGILEEHLVIVPVEHKVGSWDICEKTVKEICIYMKSIKEYFKKEKNGCECFFFERGELVDGLRHMIIQAIPIRKEVIPRLSDVVREVGQQFEIDIKIKKNDGNLRGCMDELRDKKIENFFWADMGEVGKILVNVEEGKKLPSNFGRMIAATCLGKKERMQWRRCILSKEKERRIAERVSEEISEIVEGN